jgi:hypothetical protein
LSFTRRSYSSYITRFLYRSIKKTWFIQKQKTLAIANDKTYTKKQQALNIKKLDLDKCYVGKEVPIIYYRKDPNYSKIDVYDESLRN